MHDKVLIETFPRKMGNKKRHFLICYAFEGRNVHQTLGFLISKRMQRYNLKPLGFVATDYALAIWSMKEINDIKSLFNEDLMISDLYEWLDDTPLMKKNFRDASIISGLIERKMPGLTKTSKQILFNTDLIYDVLKKHEGNHLLLKVAKEDSLNGLISIDRLGKLIKRIQNKILFKKPTTFAKPIALIKSGRLLLIERCENDWCYVSTEKFKGWVDKDNLWGM